MRIIVLVALIGALLTPPALASTHRHHRHPINPATTCWHHGQRCMKAVVKPFKPWLRGLRACESGGRNVNSTFDGYYQFSPSTWRRVDVGYAYQYGLLRQGYGAVRWLRKIGWSNRATTAGWPNCSPW